MHNRKPRWLMATQGGVLAALCAIVWLLALPQAGGAAPFAPPPPSPGAPSVITLNKFLYVPIVLRPVLVAYDWPQFGFDAQHSGNDTSEGLISAGNVISLHEVFQQSLGFAADGAPAFLYAIATISGTRDVLFVTTRDGRIEALDAHAGIPIWQKQHGPGACTINKGGTACYTTSSPAIDPNRHYVYSYGLDGKAHKHAVSDGTETLDANWPETTTLKAYDEKGSPALAIATAQNGTSYLYVANGGYPGDAGDYQGHVTAINLSDGSQKVFNTLCSNQAVHFADKRVGGVPDCVSQQQAAVWARPGVIYNPLNDEIYFSTGNGTFAPDSFHWGDSVLAVHADGTGASGKPLDSYTPVNYQDLQNSDQDLGSTAPALLPVAGGKYPHMAVQGGKDGKLRLINTDNLSGQGGPGFTGGDLYSLTIPMGSDLLTQPAVWTKPDDLSTWVFVANSSGIAGLQLVIDGGGNPTLQTVWSKSGSSFQGTTPIVANNVLFYAHSGLVMARDPLTGNQLWSDNHIGTIHWSSPIVVNGMLYVADASGRLTGYALP